MMRLYAIKHTPTGRFLPSAKGRNGRGFTHVEPTADQLPRLFPRKQDAKIALSWWLKGVVSVVPCPSSYESFVNDDEEWIIEPQAHRKAEEYQVVPLLLTEAFI